MHHKDFNLQRLFTVQALSDSQFLSINMKNLQRMTMQFNQQFMQLFKKSELTLKRALQYKFNAIQAMDNRRYLLDFKEFAKKKEKQRRRVAHSSDSSESDCEDMEREVFNTHIDNKFNNISSFFYKGAKQFQDLRVSGDSRVVETSSDSGLQTDSSMKDYDYEQEMQNQYESPVKDLDKEKTASEGGFSAHWSKLKKKFLKKSELSSP